MEITTFVRTSAKHMRKTGVKNIEDMEDVGSNVKMGRSCSYNGHQEVDAASNRT